MYIDMVDPLDLLKDKKRLFLLFNFFLTSALSLVSWELLHFNSDVLLEIGP